MHTRPDVDTVLDAESFGSAENLTPIPPPPIVQPVAFFIALTEVFRNLI